MTESQGKPVVVGTAGHVDHGKSSLIQALTGVDPDRLPQEKQRGMTLDLGFANLNLPSGRVVSFVDVPGHERLVATMVAGATGIDAGMLVVAADEGVMPQTREHIAILDLLAVDSCLIAITKTDLVDADMLALVAEDVREAVSGTVLADADVVPVSARSGAGILSTGPPTASGPRSTNLVEALEMLSARVETSAADVSRLVVDRVFTIKGFGTVVTGPSSGPGFTVGDEVELFPQPRRARIRGIQQRGEAAASAGHGRSALNLTGIPRESITRGDVVAPPGSMEDCARFDARLRLCHDAKEGLDHMREVTVHLGAAVIPGRVFPLEAERIDPGREGWVQVRLAQPAAAWRGQRFIIRIPSPPKTIGGG